MTLPVITLGDLRKATKDLPDDTAIALASTEEDFVWYEVSPASGMRYFPAALDAPPALLLSGGQEITEDHYLVARLDAYLENGIGESL